MLNFENKSKYDVYDLQRLIKLLRSPAGCPWDRVQTHESIRRNFLEETYEAVEAIDEGDPRHLCEELDDVADMCVRKLISRHPHVFGDGSVTSTGQVLDNWDAIKRVEKDQKTVTDAVNAVARTLPGLWRAEKIQNKTAKAGFDWPETAQSLQKLREELEELEAAQKDGGDPREELGDLLFAAVNVSRHLGMDPDAVLQEACDKFARRFGETERQVLAQGKTPEQMSAQELLAIWNHVKRRIHRTAPLDKVKPNIILEVSTNEQN